MQAYIITRLFHSVIVVFLVSVLIFGALHLAPGDPLTILLGQQNVSETQIEEIKKKWGLDRPLYRQYFSWISNFLRGDFGKSFSYNGIPVKKLVFNRIPNTAALNLSAYIIVLLVGIPVGIISAVKQYSLLDYFTTSISVLAMSIPNFWLGLMLLILFSLTLGWLPFFGIQGWKSFILPSITVAAMNTAILMRFTRSNFLEEIRKDYVNTAKAKGLAQKVIVYKHILRNVACSLVTLIGYRLAYILSGTIVVEVVFAWPGVGRLLVNAIFRRDYYVVQAVTFIAALIIVLVNLLTDVSYAFIDPRIRYD